MSATNEKLIRYAGTAALVIVLIYACYTVITKDKQWDFRTYYHAAKAHQAELDPYVIENLNAVSDEEITLDYVYPPVTLYFFAPFLMFDFPTAYYLFFALKLIALVLLVRIWYRRFLPEKTLAIILLVLVAFAFRETIIRDIYAGNISIFEQLLIWAAAPLFLDRKIAGYCLLIGLAAIFKFALVLLLLLPLIDRDRKATWWVVGTGVTVAGVGIVSYFASPLLMEGFLANVSTLDIGGHADQTSLAVIKEILIWLSGATGGEFVRLATAFHIAFALFLLAVTVRIARGSDFRSNRLAFLVLCLFLYALIMPRLKDYSYILLIIPSFYVVATMLKSAVLRLAAIFFICVSFLPYQAFLTAFALYLVYLSQLKRVTASASQPVCSAKREPSAS